MTYGEKSLLPTRDLLRDMGFESSIYVAHGDARLASGVRDYRELYEAVPRGPARAAIEPEPAERVVALRGRLGYLRGLATGFVLLVGRAARSHVRRLVRRRRMGLGAALAPLRA